MRQIPFQYYVISFQKQLMCQMHEELNTLVVTSVLTEGLLVNYIIVQHSICTLLMLLLSC